MQWLTAGKGIVHAEMFPLRDRSAPNPLELFQIWLNLPSADKLAPPHFTMFWRDAVPVLHDDGVEVTLIAGRLGQRRPPSPPPRSWAAREENEVAICTIRLAARASWTLPPASPGVNRTLYFFRGGRVTIAGTTASAHATVRLRPDAAARLEVGDEACELLLLQGRPIGEPVMQYGPFVMNTRAELQQAFADYQRTQFGGWPWDEDGPVHAREEERFAKHADGRVERA